MKIKDCIIETSMAKFYESEEKITSSLKTTISFCIMTFNEERSIRRCIDSIKDIADEIVIVDSESTDATAKIIKEEYPFIQFIQRPWNKDFSEVRNILTHSATCD